MGKKYLSDYVALKLDTYCLGKRVRKLSPYFFNQISIKLAHSKGSSFHWGTPVHYQKNNLV